MIIHWNELGEFFVDLFVCAGGRVVLLVGFGLFLQFLSVGFSVFPNNWSLLHEFICSESTDSIELDQGHPKYFSPFLHAERE